jgi:hypothetical protein
MTTLEKIEALGDKLEKLAEDIDKLHGDYEDILDEITGKVEELEAGIDVKEFVYSLQYGEPQEQDLLAELIEELQRVKLI